MRNISVKKMHVFVAAVESGSFSIGAQRSNISQPAAVNIINEIEEAAGAELFVRNGKTRNAQLNKAGEQVYNALVWALSAYNQALDAISPGSLSRKEQPVFIQNPYVPAVSVRWLKMLHGAFQDRKLCIQAAERSEIRSSIERGQGCIAVIDGYDYPKNSDYVMLGISEIVFAFSACSEFVDPNITEISWVDIPKETLVYSAIWPSAVEQIFHNLNSAGHRRNDFSRVNSTDLLGKLCLEAGHPAIIPRVMAKSMTNQKDFRIVPFSCTKVHLPLGLSLPFGHRGKAQLRQHVFQDTLPLDYPA